MRVTIKTQKYLICIFLFAVNLLLSTTCIIFEKNWYIFLFILCLASMLNTFSVFCILGKKMITGDTKELHRTTPKKYVYIIPCYNESEEELKNSINSLVLQREVKNDRRSLLIVCDGVSTGKGNRFSTDKILKDLLKIKNDTLGEFYDYKTWNNSRNIIKIYNGVYTHANENIEFILMIKNENYGKRDSLVLARKLCYNYNNKNTINGIAVSDAFLTYIYNLYKHIYETSIDYMIGIDADTIFDYNCSYELIQCIEKEPNIFGSVGYVDIQPSKTVSNYYPMILYQYGEYMFSQCLRRYAQSNITKKVNCLSGCNQILKVCKETCGHGILNVLNYLPQENESIFNHIRSYASEDRNHVCHMLSMYPYVKSTQTLKAIAYTNVPTNINVFLSQRRRWNLGAMTNDMLLIRLPGINILERISAFINLFTYSLSPFIFIATILFIKSIIKENSMLMLYLSVLIIVPIIYAFLILILIRPLSFMLAMYYYFSYLFFILIGSIITLLTYTYSVTHMDVIKWGKTRAADSRALTIEEPKPKTITSTEASRINNEREVNQNNYNDYNEIDSEYVNISNIINIDSDNVKLFINNGVSEI